MKPKITNGPDLRAYRLARRVHQSEVAREMGLSPGRVCHIEGKAEVSPEIAERYCKAVKTVLEGGN